MAPVVALAGRGEPGSMGRYNDSAEVLASGERYECQADLSSGYEQVRIGTGEVLPGLPWWRGMIELDDDQAAGMVEAVEYAALLINGSEAKFRVLGRQGRRLSIRSNGSRAPF